MYGRNLVICDRERQYAKNLLRIFSSKHESGVQLYLFYTLEELRRFSEQRKIHILLIAGEYLKEEREEIPADSRYVLIRDNKPLPDGEKGVLRYQSAEAIWTQIFKNASKPEQEQEQKPEFVTVRTNGAVIGVYSPVRRIGKTRFAIGMGKKLAEKEPVLYLNLEEYSGEAFYFQEKPEGNLGDLLYYYRQERDNLGIRISTMAGQTEKLDYIYPMPYLQDLKAVKKDEWLGLLERIRGECIYGKVILDIGDSVDGLFEILKACDVIYTPYIDDSISMAKLTQYTESLRKTGMEEILEKTVQKLLRKKTAVRAEKSKGDGKAPEDSGERREQGGQIKRRTTI